MFSNSLKRMKSPLLEYEQWFGVAWLCKIRTKLMMRWVQFLENFRFATTATYTRTQFIIKDLRYLFDVITDLLVATFIIDHNDASFMSYSQERNLSTGFLRKACQVDQVSPSLNTLLQQFNIVSLLRKECSMIVGPGSNVSTIHR